MKPKRKPQTNASFKPASCNQLTRNVNLKPMSLSNLLVVINEPGK